jgi:hypothetical protein
MTEIKDWYSQGCADCRQAVLSGNYNGALMKLTTNIRAHAILHRCKQCGAFWIENEREAHEIDQTKVAEVFGQQFLAN